MIYFWFLLLWRDIYFAHVFLPIPVLSVISWGNSRFLVKFAWPNLKFSVVQTICCLFYHLSIGQYNMPVLFRFTGSDYPLVSSNLFVIYALVPKDWWLVGLWFMVFNATFNNISVISWRSFFFWWRWNQTSPEKISDLSQFTEKLYHIMDWNKK